MSIVDNIRIRQNWDPTGEKGGYKIDYNYQEPNTASGSGAVFGGLPVPRNLGMLRRNITTLLHHRVLTASDIGKMVKRVLGRTTLDGCTHGEGRRVWGAIEKMVDERYSGLALSPASLSPPQKLSFFRAMSVPEDPGGLRSRIASLRDRDVISDSELNSAMLIAIGHAKFEKIRANQVAAVWRGLTLMIERIYEATPRPGLLGKSATVVVGDTPDMAKAAEIQKQTDNAVVRFIERGDGIYKVVASIPAGEEEAPDDAARPQVTPGPPPRKLTVPFRSGWVGPPPRTPQDKTAALAAGYSAGPQAFERLRQQLAAGNVVPWYTSRYEK